MLSYFLFAFQFAFCAADWVGWGGNPQNTRLSSDGTIESSSIKSMVVDCQLDFPTGVSATPSIVNDLAYFPTWNGSFVALDIKTCSTVWTINVTRIIYEAVSGFDNVVGPSPHAALNIPAVSKTTPQIVADTLFFGTMLSALMVAVNASDGAVIYVTQLDAHPFAIVSTSPGWATYSSSSTASPDTEALGLVLVGTDSMEQAVADNLPGYNCCSFVGQFLALNFDGSKLTAHWNVSMVPESLVKHGWTGVPIYGSQPATNADRIYIATGSAYTVPRTVTSCYKSVWNSTTTWRDSCLPNTIFAESVLSLDVETGAVNWVRQLSPINSRAAACGDPEHVVSRYPGYVPVNQSLCLKAPSIDADASFGMAPSFLSAGANTPGKGIHNGDTDVVIVGQKNGNLYCFAYDTGQTLWATNVGIYGAAAELAGGIAIDDERVYYTQRWQNTDGNRTFGGSAYGSADLTTGLMRWVVPTLHQSAAYNPPTIVGDIFLGGYYERGAGTSNNTGSYGWHVPNTQFNGSSGVNSQGTGRNETGVGTNSTTPMRPGAGKGALIALDKATGSTLQEMQLQSVFSGGIAFDNGRLLFGTGDCWPDEQGSFYMAHFA